MPATKQEEGKQKMTDVLNQVIDFGGLKGQRPSEGDAPSILKQDGTYHLARAEMEAGESGNKNVTLKMKFLVQDTDEKSAVIYKTFTLTGNHSFEANGKTETRSNLEQSGFGAYLQSCGMSETYVDGLGSKKLSDIITDIKDRKDSFAWVRTKADKEGQDRSEAVSFVTQKTYDRRKATGASWRKDRRQAVSRPTTNGNARSTSSSIASDAAVAEV